MSNYTTQIRYICETLAGLTKSEGFNSVPTIIAAARPKIFDFTYPIFDDEHKVKLETRILEYYYMQEIGVETYALFKLKLANRLNLIMPKYNKMYEQIAKDYDLFYDTDYTEDNEHNSDTTNTRTDDFNETFNNTDRTSQTHGGTDKDESRDKTIASTDATNKLVSESNDIDRTNKTVGTTGNNKETDTTTSGTTSVNSTTTTNDSTNTRTDNTQSATTGTHWQYNNETPQGGINGLDSLEYLSSATKSTINDTVKNTGTVKDVLDSNGTVRDNGTVDVDTTSDKTTTIKQDVNEDGQSTKTHNGTDNTTISSSDNSETTGSLTKTYGHTITGNDTHTGSRDNTGTQHNVGNEQGSGRLVVKGKRGGETYLQLLKQLDSDLFNVDYMVIRELETLFMQIY